MSERRGSERPGTGAPASGHLAPERISRLLEEPEVDPRGAAHLEGCDACRLEYERMSRMRMALSGLGGLEPPAGQWAAIRARLDAAGNEQGAGDGAPDGDGRRRAGGDAAARPTGAGAGRFGRRVGRGTLRVLASWPLQAAAAVALFTAGILAGLNLPEAERDGAAGAEAPADAAVASAPAPTESHYLEPGAELDELQGLLPPARATGADLDPMAAAERLARLDALILASQEALERAPADPVANGLLFDLVERRDALANDLQESLRLVTLEYR